MKYVGVVFAFLTVLCAMPTHAQESCLDIYKSESIAVIDENALTQEIEMIWYPKTSFVVISHTELIVGRTVWDGTGGFNNKGDRSIRERAAQRGKGYFSFHLKVSRAEVNRMNEFLESRDGETRIQTCVAGACKAVTKNTGIVIPFPISQVPTLTSIYLTALHTLGYKRVTKIEWIGQRNFRQFLTIQPLYEAGTSFLAAHTVFAIAVAGVNALGEEITHVIPVVSE